MSKDIRWISFEEAEQRYGGGSGGNASIILHSSGDSSDPAAHPYTADNSGIIVKDANNVEVFRLWGSDPDTTDNFNSGNLYFGYQAGLAQPSDNSSAGFNNVGIGWQSLLSITTGFVNVAIGTGTLSSLTTGDSNIAIGYNALSLSSTGHANTAVGSNALENSVNDHNTSIGYLSLNKSVNGSSNTAIGSHAGFIQDPNTGGDVINDDNLVLIGAQASRIADIGVTLSNAIAIGAQATVGASNTAVLGNGSITDVYFGSASGNAKLHGKGDAIIFPDSDPHVAGAAYWVGGVLTKSNG